MKDGKGFMGSQYIWNDGNYRRYYSVRPSIVEIWVFQKDNKTGRYLPYAPAQSKITLTNFKKLLKVRPSIKKIK